MPWGTFRYENTVIILRRCVTPIIRGCNSFCAFEKKCRTSTRSSLELLHNFSRFSIAVANKNRRISDVLLAAKQYWNSARNWRRSSREKILLSLYHETDVSVGRGRGLLCPPTGGGECSSLLVGIRDPRRPRWVALTMAMLIPVRTLVYLQTRRWNNVWSFSTLMQAVTQHGSLITHSLVTYLNVAYWIKYANTLHLWQYLMPTVERVAIATL